MRELSQEICAEVVSSPTTNAGIGIFGHKENATTTRGGLLRHYEPVCPGAARRHADSLFCNIPRHKRAAREIAARPRKTLGNPELDRITANGKKDRDVSGPLQGTNRRTARDHQVHVPVRQLGDHWTKHIGIA
jgi:hypothetical protein